MTSATALPAPVGLDPSALGFEKVRYAKQGARATITIHRPEVYNCLDFQTLRELTRAFEDASWDDQVAVVVLTGAGDRAFCTGADLKEQEHFFSKPNDYWKWMGAFIEALEKLRNIGKPTIARLNGMTVGGGNEFNMACDLAVAAEHAVIRQVGTARGSVPAGGATQWLPIMVGDRRAREILWLCDEIPAAKALDWGLVNRVVPASELDAEVDRMVAKLVDRLPDCMRYTKEQTNFWKAFAWNQTIGHARDWLTVHSDANEVREGIRAFNEKRPIDYAGVRRAMQQGARTCPQCGETGLNPQHAFCGHCGHRFEEA
jgi:enoyl-CoA hydratase/carnithine racemase